MRSSPPASSRSKTQYTTGNASRSAGEGPSDPQLLLQAAEGRLHAVVSDKLAVQQQPIGALGRERSSDLGIGAREILTGAGLEPDCLAFLEGNTALAVELAFQQPAVAEIAAIGQRRQHHPDRNHISSRLEWRRLMSGAFSISVVISRSPRPRVTKLITQRMKTSSRFWKPIR